MASVKTKGATKSAHALRQDNCDLLGEAERLESAIGCNPYSTFLRKHRFRPSADQASTIGRLLGGRVRASDGKMYPVLTKGEKEAIAGIRERQKTFAKGLGAARAVRILLDNCTGAPPIDAADHAGWPLNIKAEDVDAAIAWLIEFRGAMS